MAQYERIDPDMHKAKKHTYMDDDMMIKVSENGT